MTAGRGVDAPPAKSLRIDRLLWFLRLAKTRASAQVLVGEGHIRRNGARVERASQAVATGDRLVLPRHGGVLAIELLSLPSRRGPAAEARAHYRVLDETRLSPLAAQATNAASQGDLQP